jgi:ATP-dependent protease ClpP protease subunit
VKRRLRAGLVGCALRASFATFGGPYDQGVAAYDQGQYATALSLWLPLAEQGNAAAQYNVAVLFEKGQGVAQSYQEAARWYLKAAEQGDPDAQVSIAVLYEKGLGVVARSPSVAQKWYALAAANPRASSRVKERARKRYADLSHAREEVVHFDGGRFVIAPSQDICVIALQGTITTDTSYKFEEAIAESAKLGCGESWLLLESPGGAIDDGIRVAREVRFKGLRTITRAECASACSLIFVAGTERVLAGSRARIGLHQPATARDYDKSRRCASGSDSNGVSEIRKFLRWAVPDTADRIMDIVLGTSCDSIEWIQGQQALDLAIATRLASADAEMPGQTKR